MADRHSSCVSIRCLIVVLFFVECLLYAGIIFGWASLSYVFRKIGYFSYLCDDRDTASSTFPPPSDRVNKGFNVRMFADPAADVPYKFPTELTSDLSFGPATTCVAQEEKIFLVYAIGQTGSCFLMTVTGAITDYCSMTISRFLCCALLDVGFLLIAFSTVPTSALLFPGMLSIAVAGYLLISLNIKIGGDYFLSWKGTITAAICGSFDSSAVMGLIVEVSYYYGLSIRIIFLILTASTVIYIVNTFFIIIEKRKENEPELDDLSESYPLKQTEEVDFLQVDFPTMRCCLTSPLFLSLVFFVSVLQLQNQYFIGAFNSWITEFTNGNDNKVAYYTTVFNAVQMVGIIFAPMLGYLMDKKVERDITRRDPLLDMKNSRLAFAITSMVFAVFSFLILIPVINLQYLSFLLICVGRAFLYGVSVGFLNLAFPNKFFGRLYGILICASAVVTLMQYPLFDVVKGPLHGHHFYVNLGIFLAVLLTFSHPIYVHMYVKRKETALLRQKLTTGDKTNYGTNASSI